MTQRFEQMSAFMDGESAANNVVDSLSEESDLQSTWGRYHVVRSVMRKEMPEGDFLDISASIAQALEAEPVILAPKAASSGSFMSKVSAKIMPFARQSGQFAVAASVAAAVIIGVQTYNQPESNEPFAIATTAAPQGGLAPVSYNQTRELPSSHTQQEILETRRQIQALLSDHEQQVKLKSAKSDSVSKNFNEELTPQ